MRLVVAAASATTNNNNNSLGTERMLQESKRDRWTTTYQSTHSQRDQNDTEKSSYSVN